MMLLNNNESSSIHYKGFMHMKQKQFNFAERSSLIQQPNQFPQINTTLQKNESIGFST
jgi:hypothetical protein